MELVISQKIYYSNKELVPVNDIASSLLALDYIIRLSPKVLHEIFPEARIYGIDVFISELKSGSIYEDLVVKFLFGSQEKLDIFVEQTRQKLGIEKIMNKPEILSTILLGLIFAGGIHYLNKNDPTKEKSMIEANNNTIIQIGAGLVDLSANDFQAIINNAVSGKDKDKLAKAALQVVKPAKLDPNASITFNSDSALQVNKEAIKQIPRSFNETEEKVELIEDYTNIELEIRATDLDSAKTGWAVAIPSMENKRVRLQIDPRINREALLDVRSIHGDTTIIFGYDKNHKKVPKIVFLREIISSSNI
ncbi:hypothetical protein V6238_12180 [Marinomonas arenicola]|uniref:hypothetical protein n=1 Tax=Marinomonas arenicola TaxID=569601 RepID=UPI00311ECA9F